MRVTRSNVSKKVYRLKDFRGVDYSSSPLEVQPYRSTDMANFILRDGVLHKRNGWEKIIKAAMHEDTEVLNVWRFDETRFIVRTKSWKKTNVGNNQGRWVSKFLVWDTTKNEVKTVSSGSDSIIYLDDEFATAIKKDDVLYVFCRGIKKIYYLEEPAERRGMRQEDVGIEYGDWFDENEEKSYSNYLLKKAYIPKTTINIIPFNAVKLDASIWQRTTNEYINLLSPWRKNELIWEPSTTVLYYQLDGIAYERSYADYMMEKTDPENYEGNGFVRSAAPTITCTLGVLDPIKITFSQYKANDTAIQSVGALVWKADKYNMYLGSPQALKAHGINAQGKNPNNSILVVPANFAPFGTQSAIESKGYDLGDVKLTVEYLSQENVDVNQSYTYEDGVTEYYPDNLIVSDLIYVRKGIVFGANGADDRLFLAQGNKVYYSENNNFEYFPAINVIVCGEDDYEITAFEKISDGTLAVFKDVKDSRSVGVYYISGRYQNLGAGVEGNTYYAELFSVSAGNINESGIAVSSTCNLSGDNLFVSDNGVFGLVLSENSASMERYARERSRTINAKLKEFDLSQAKAIVHDNKYYLAVGGENNEVYVADARYKYNTEGDLYGAYSYEWFRFTGIPVSTWFLHNNELWFGTKDGWLCKFHDGFTDIYETDEGDMTVTELNENEYGVVFNSSEETSILPIIQAAAYAVDTYGNHWEVGEIHTYTDESGNELHYISVPSYISVPVGAIVLKFHIPIHSYWKSAIVDFDKSYARKNLWSLSASVMPVSRGRLTMGYKTRLSIAENISVDGANVFNFGDIDFTNFSFDCGGFVNAYRVPVFERGFIYLQLMFSSNSDGDAVVNELVVEYNETVKNIGVG